MRFSPRGPGWSFQSLDFDPLAPLAAGLLTSVDLSEGERRQTYTPPGWGDVSQSTSVSLRSELRSSLHEQGITLLEGRVGRSLSQSSRGERKLKASSITHTDFVCFPPRLPFTGSLEDWGSLPLSCQPVLRGLTGPVREIL